MRFCRLDVELRHADKLLEVVTKPDPGDLAA